MKISIQTKVLILCIILVLLTAAGISTTYYVLTKQDKQRESRQRIQIAFDIILSDFANRTNTYLTRFDEFLKEDTRVLWATDFYKQDASSLGSASVIAGYFVKAVAELKKFGHIISADRLFLYGTDKRLLMLYQQKNAQDTSGLYVVTETGENTFLAADDPDQLNQILFGGQPIPEIALPSGVSEYFEGDISDTISASVFHDGPSLGIRVTAPVYHKEVKVGILVGEVFYTRDIVEHYALLSKTAVNFFAGNQLSIGTLSAQSELESEVMGQMVSCEDLMAKNVEIDVVPFILTDQDYDQGRCALKNAQGTVGAEMNGLIYRLTDRVSRNASTMAFRWDSGTLHWIL